MIILCNIIILHCEISNDNSPDTVIHIQDAHLLMQYGQITIEGSTDETETSTYITTTLIETTIFTTNISLTTDTISVSSHTSTTTSANGSETSTTTTPPPNTCNDTSQIQWINGTCISKSEAQTLSVNILRNNSTNSTEKSNALFLYFGSTDSFPPKSNATNLLTPGDIDDIVDGLNNVSPINSSTGFLFALPTKNGTDTLLGGSFNPTANTEIVTNNNKMRILNSSALAAAIIDNETVHNTESISVFILHESKAYKNLDISNNQSLVSPVIIFGVKKNVSNSSITTFLYFQVSKENEMHNHDQYKCSFFNSNTSKWDTAGCTKPKYNETHTRYECSCNHLTTFALIWSPNLANTTYLTSQDIASMIFLSVSILCFIAVIIHSFTTRLLNRLMSMNARDLLPLISSASTTILFIFFIALSMTVYTQTTPENGTKCFLSSMGFKSNSSYNITQLHKNKLCWFTQDVVYYFMTIPIGIFLLLNLITIIFVARRIINHVRYARSPHHTYKRMKQFVIVLLSSSVTQGIGWLIGPILTIVNSNVGNILSWFFIVCNGLEGVWTILLYIIIRSERMNEPKRVTHGKKHMKKLFLASAKNKKKEKITDFNSVSGRIHQVSHRNDRKYRSIFDDLYDTKSVDWQTSIYPA
ncbi:unnamed protein product [Rotaria sp. Silwood2]|nr:unnamed protein product [Rotaria sp. Silwood2]CAF2485293.1 unnamed protein product [Rotaria sp. Silwood2]CAF2717075.1 unnamed protein product [Rotaria sp. Silwood2]CAF2868861.1 unnamed protein product [Rotaria sp. Silwood2]CAF4336957.1 unnamed protein product [Rotaria sp. Silwood2]